MVDYDQVPTGEGIWRALMAAIPDHYVADDNYEDWCRLDSSEFSGEITERRDKLRSKFLLQSTETVLEEAVISCKLRAASPKVKHNI